MQNSIFILIYLSSQTSISAEYPSHQTAVQAHHCKTSAELVAHHLAIICRVWLTTKALQSSKCKSHYYSCPIAPSEVSIFHFRFCRLPANTL